MFNTIKAIAFKPTAFQSRGIQSHGIQSHNINGSARRSGCGRLLVSAGALALLAGAANAQFVVERIAQPEAPAAPVVKESSTQTMIMTTDEGKVYKVVIKNNEIENAWVDGKKVGSGLVVRQGDQIQFLTDDGELEQTFSMSIAPPKAPKPLSFFNTQGDQQTNFSASMRSNPPVMLGINLSEPGDAMRAQLGLGDTPAILVDGVIDGLPASKAGLKKFDVIVSIDGSEGSSSQSLTKVLSAKAAGDPLQLHVLRGGKKIELVAKLAAYDANALGHQASIIYDDDADARFPAWNAKPGGEKDVQVWIDRGEGKGLELENRATLPGDQAEAAQRELGALRRAQEDMQSKVTDAMREAERRVLELRNGKLIFRDADEAAAIAGDRLAALEERFRGHLPGMERELDERLELIERRFDAIESRFDEQIDQLGQRMERLADIMDRLADRLERAADRD